MIQFIVYDRETGAVKRNGVCQPSDLQLQAEAGEGVIQSADGVVSYAEINLDPLKAQALEKIDREAGEFRLHFITDVPGQQLTYSRKEREARAYVAADTPTSSDFPFLAAEAAETGQSILSVANGVIAAADAWEQMGAAIEGKRMGAKRAVQAAASIPEIVMASAVNWDALIP